MAPAIEIIKMQNEGGIMAGSINMGDGSGTNPFPSAAPTRTGGTSVQSASPLQELEDMLNDVFTIIQS